ncbi:hypothetical protein IMSHALPRED_003490 [Imshaugia aleurites]|uniref:Mitotic checkpoint regulator, MAD2B-interacting-domain-containing protein n=1 Tax=Imshaugia aleurites TaxID=172621 RepID=A0A8H3FAF0_9LECA|nr:hypothetical protein IMSHALPRED_003490 [Imshaugia aleurites]
MALVDYSGSESDSEKDEKATLPESIRPKPTSTKPTFQKVVDRSNPRKVKVSLPEPAQTKPEDRDDESGPPTKRAKVGSGGASGFNSFLPAPKRTTAPNGGPGAGGIRRGGLGSGVNLKTGAAPGFSRESEPSLDESSGWDESAGGGSVVESPIQNAVPSSMDKRPDMPTPEVDTQLKKKSTIFKPLSVANKRAQKKKVPPADGLHAPGSTNGGTSQQPSARPKASLFSTGDEAVETSSGGSSTKGKYQPMVYHADTPTTTPTPNPYSEEDNTTPDYPTAESTNPQDQPTQTQTQSLDTIATDLNLSASAKRQLLGRHHHSNNKSHPSQPSTIPNIVNFNTDEEYAANELLRQAGETVQHNPVRGIAPGKHSLKQLVNAASNQKDALEEQFASGRRNKKEAGSKYGW